MKNNKFISFSRKFVFSNATQIQEQPHLSRKLKPPSQSSNIFILSQSSIRKTMGTNDQFLNLEEDFERIEPTTTNSQFKQSHISTINFTKSSTLTNEAIKN